MKSTLRYLSLFCILITIPLAIMWATWEGNAGTGATADFPGSGLYARSDMFPRNTLVKIVNLETGSSVRAVITGSSGVPGLVAVLSPETAAALNIREGEVVRVRITTPAPVGEQPAPGTQKTGDELTVADPDMNPEAMVPLAAIAGAGEAPMVPVPDSVEPETFDEARETFNLDTETMPEGTEDVAVSEPEITDSEILPEESVDLAESESPNGDIAAEETFVDETKARTDTVPGELMDEGAVAASEEEPGVTDVTDGIVASEEAPVPETTESEVFYEEPELVAAEDPADETVEEITLEPAEPRPPEVDMATFPVVPPVVTPDDSETTENEDAGESVPYVEPVEETPIEEKPVFAAVSHLDKNPAEKSPPVESEPSTEAVAEISRTDFPWIDRLESGAYYVQIAAYKDSVNVRSILNRFSEKYPVVVQKTDSSGTPLMKVYIGPLKKDEYGAVLEYFHKNGFSDAFMRQQP